LRRSPSSIHKVRRKSQLNKDEVLFRKEKDQRGLVNNQLRRIEAIEEESEEPRRGPFKLNKPPLSRHNQSMINSRRNKFILATKSTPSKSNPPGPSAEKTEHFETPSLPISTIAPVSKFMVSPSFDNRDENFNSQQTDNKRLETNNNLLDEEEYREGRARQMITPDFRVERRKAIITNETEDVRPYMDESPSLAKKKNKIQGFFNKMIPIFG